MKKVSLSKLVGGLLAKDAVPVNPWHPERKPYPRLLDLNAATEGLNGQRGIYAVWHLGVRPQWLRVGAAASLGAALNGLARQPWVAQHHNNAGVFVAWAFVAPEQCAGTVRYLAEKLKPAFQAEAYDGDLPVDPVATLISIMLPPGTR